MGCLGISCDAWVTRCGVGAEGVGRVNASNMDITDTYSVMQITINNDDDDGTDNNKDDNDGNDNTTYSKLFKKTICSKEAVTLELFALSFFVVKVLGL